MTILQKHTITRMRSDGASYPQIAEALGLSINTIKSFVRRAADPRDQEEISDGARRCLRCGEAYQQQPNRKPKLFCSAKCRQAWWYANRATSSTTPKAACAHCGASFPVARGQKYCSHACCISARFGGEARAHKISDG